MQLARKQLALGRMPGGFHDALSRALAKLRFHAVRYNGPGRRGPQIRGFEGSQMLPGIFGELLRRILGACPSTRAEELKASGMKLRPIPPPPLRSGVYLDAEELGALVFWLDKVGERSLSLRGTFPL